MTILLDWSSRGPNGSAAVWPPQPCIHCGDDALLRDPITDRPCHKVCAEAAIERQAAAITSRAA